MSGKDEVYVEFIAQGNFVKATAIHAASGLEASVMGPAGAARAALADAAMRKLTYLIKKQNGGS
jgi:hypothetical protein